VAIAGHASELDTRNEGGKGFDGQQDELARDSRPEGGEENGYLLQAGWAIRTVQALLGHQDVATTMIDTDVLNRPGVVPVAVAGGCVVANGELASAFAGGRLKAISVNKHTAWLVFSPAFFVAAVRA